MVSKNQMKFIKSLQSKKYRYENKLFIAEGVKVIQELLESNFELHHLYVTEAIFEKVPNSLKTVVSEQEMKNITALSTPSSCLAIFNFSKEESFVEEGLIVALDAIRDPGNLGTIIRLCDWFGIRQLLCSAETVDIYNPKVVQATMGSLARVAIKYVDLENIIAKSSLPVFGTFMDGEVVYKQDLPSQGIIVFGNESNGISNDLEKLITNRITIPRFGAIQQTESLNVATATAIILSEFCRATIN